MAEKVAWSKRYGALSIELSLIIFRLCICAPSAILVFRSFLLLLLFSDKTCFDKVGSVALYYCVSVTPMKLQLSSIVTRGASHTCCNNILFLTFDLSSLHRN